MAQRVEPIFVAWDAADDKFVTMVAGGSAPDVFLAELSVRVAYICI
ncbi:MAG: hypothetical protein ACOX4G_10935 [Limnochordia bacterium]